MNIIHIDRDYVEELSILIVPRFLGIASIPEHKFK